jgi:general stress protein CsbA
MWFALLKNPLTKLLFEKTAGAISHKLKKDAIIKQKELDHVQSVDVQSLKSSDNSLKDEWLVIVFSLIFVAHFVPVLQEAMLRGWEILELASDYFWIIILTIVGGSFGSSGITKLLKKKK